MAEGTVPLFVKYIWLICSVHTRYIVRREPGGPVYDREEPNVREIIFPSKVVAEGDPHDDSVVALEFLYNHFQGEKYKRESGSFPIVMWSVNLRLMVQLGGPFLNTLSLKMRCCL
jgi:hypothetical protein